MPLTLTLLSAAFPIERRTAALGLWSSIAGLGVALGPLLGGILVRTLDWHWIFWINVPIGLTAAVLAPRRLSESRGAQVPLDLPGLALASGGLLGIVWATTRGNAEGWTSSSTLLAYAAGAVLLVAFVLQERRSAAPMLPLALFRRPGFTAANAAGFGLHFTMFAAFFIIIQYLTQVHGDSAIQAGVETLPWTLMPLALSPFTGSLGGRIGSRPFVVAGLLLLAAGTAGSALAMGVGSSYAELVVPLLAIGVGIALVLPNVASAALGSALPEHIGKASGTNTTFRQLGGVFGIAVAVLVFDRAGSYATPESIVDGARAALFVAAIVAVLGAAGALGIPGRARTPVARPGTRAQLSSKRGSATCRAQLVSSPRDAALVDEARDQQPQAAVRDHPVRQAGHRDEAPVGEGRTPAGHVRRGIERVRASGEQQHRDAGWPQRVGAPRGVRDGGADLPDELRARHRGVRQKALAARAGRRGDSRAGPRLTAQDRPDHGQARARVELAAHECRVLACERLGESRGSLVHDQGDAHGILGRPEERRDRQRDPVGAPRVRGQQALQLGLGARKRAQARRSRRVTASDAARAARARRCALPARTRGCSRASRRRA